MGPFSYTKEGDKMPQYGSFKYGRARYGRYILSTYDKNAIGPYVRYRMASLSGNNKSEYAVMNMENAAVSTDVQGKIRMRTNNGEWVYTQQAEINTSVYKVRARSISSANEMSPWVIYESGQIKKI